MSQPSVSPLVRALLVGAVLVGIVVTARGRRHGAAVVQATALRDSLTAASAAIEPVNGSHTGPGWDEARAARANPQPSQGLVNRRDNDDSVFAAASGAGRTTSQTYVTPLYPEPPRPRTPPNP